MTSESHVIDILASLRPELARPECLTRLEGGFVNEVWRAGTPPHSVVIKRAPPYVATRPDIALDAARIRFEATALQWVAREGISTEDVRVPHLLQAGEDFIVLEDVGPHAAWSGDAAVGARLGRFIARLHRRTAHDPRLAACLNNRSVQQARLQVQYDTVQGWCEQLGVEDAALLGDRARAVGEDFLRPGICMIMGDLWPPSVLHTASGLRIIDWEFAHFGCPSQDIAHLAAHLCLLQRLDAWKAFIEAYAAELRPTPLWDAERRMRCGIHLAAEILMRTHGPFRMPGPFDDAVVRLALSALRNPHQVSLFEALGN